MRPQAVVETPPVGDQDLRLLEGVEDLAVQELISELAVERLHIAVLPGRAGLDEQGGDPELGEPASHCCGDELGAVI